LVFWEEVGGGGGGGGEGGGAVPSATVFEQQWVKCSLVQAFEDGWPILFLTVSSSNLQCIYHSWVGCRGCRWNRNVGTNVCLGGDL